MPGPYYYEQTGPTLDILFEDERVVLAPGDYRWFDDACTTVRFINAVTAANRTVRDALPQGLEALQQECTASGGGPDGASPVLDAPVEPPPITDPGSTDGGAPASGEPETPQSLGVPDPQPAGTTTSTPRDPGGSDGRLLAQQYFSPLDPLTAYDVAQLLLDGGIAPGDLEEALQHVVRNEAPEGAMHPDFGIGNTQNQIQVRDPVELFSGEFVVTVADVEIASRGFPLRLVRHYRSGPVWFGPWGYNWDHNYNVYLRELTDGRVAVWTGELREDVHTAIPAGGFDAPVGGRELLEFQPAAGPLPNHYVLTDLNGMRRIFHTPAGYPHSDRIPLVRVEDRSGNTHELTYDPQGRPDSVTDHAGRSILFGYGDCGRLERVRDHSGRVWEYVHDDEAEHLVAVITPPTPSFPDGVTTRYEYDDRFSESPGLRHNLTKVIDPDGREVVENIYGQDPSSDDFARVVRQEVGGFNTLYTTTRLQFVPRTPDAINIPAWRVEVDDPDNLFVYTFNYRGDLLDQRVRLVLDGSLRLVARTYRYDEAGNLTERYEPNGFGCLMRYDATAADPRARGNLLRLELVAPATAPSPSRVVSRYTYEPFFHRLKTHHDELGNLTTWIFDYEELTGTVGDIVRIEYPDATLPSGALQRRHELLAYNAFGQLIQYTSGAGHIDQYDYSAVGGDVGYLRQITRDAGGAAQTQSFEYNAWGVPVAFIDGLGNRTEHDVDELGYLTAVRRPLIGGDPAETRYRYLPSGRVRRQEQPRGEFTDEVLADPYIVHDFEYDEFGTLHIARYGANTAQPLEYRYQRDPSGTLHAIVDPLGRRTILAYDERRLLLSQTEAFGLPEQATTRYLYDANGNQSAVIDPAGHRVDFAYDAWDRLREVRLHGHPDAERTRIRLSLNAFDRLERLRIDGLTAPGIIGPLFEATTTYDERGRPVRRLIVGRSVDLIYDQDERVVQQIDQRGGITRFVYDGIGRVVQATDALGNMEHHTYDAAGNLRRHERMDVLPGGGAESFVTTVDYDVRNRPTTVTDPLGRVSSQAFDARDLPVSDTDPLGRVTWRTFGLRAEVVTVGRDLTLAIAATHTMTWDAGGRMTAYRDPEGATTIYDFDARDRNTAVHYPDGGTHLFTYDARIQPATETSPGGTRRSYTYRADGALSRIDFTAGPGVAPTPAIEVFSDGLRRAVRLSQGAEAVERTYDLLRLVSETTSGGTASIGYDDSTGTARLTYPDLRVDEYQLDLLGRLESVRLSAPGGAGLTGRLAAGAVLTRCRYRGPDRLAERTHWNGWTSELSYDGAARLTGLAYLDQAGVPQQELHQVHDGAGRRRLLWAQHPPQEPASYAYDDLDRLVEVREGLPLADPGTHLDLTAANAQIAVAAGLAPRRTQAFKLNLADARTRESTDSGTGPLVRDFTLTPTYAVVNVSEGPGVVPYTYDNDGRLVADGQYTYTYDALGRLIEARAAAAVVLHQEFDPLGRVVRRTENNTTITRVHLGHRLIEEQNTGSGGPTRQYVNGPGSDEIIMISTGRNLLPLHDPLQSVLGYADDVGTVLERYRFDVFGEASVFASDGITPLTATTVGPVVYAGLPLLAMERYDARTRMYDATTGRFLQPDPSGYVDSADRYGYTHHDPLNYIDPDGDIAVLIGLAIAAGLGLLAGLGTNTIRQQIRRMEQPDAEFDVGELLWSGVTGAVLGPVLVVAPELAIPLAGLGVVSAAEEYEQGNRATAAFDLVLSVVPFFSKHVRSAAFGKGTIFSPTRGLGPVDPLSTRWGRIATMGREFLNPTEGVTRVTHVTTRARLASIESRNTINATPAPTSLKVAVEGSRTGTWVLPWRASQLRTWSRLMAGRRPLEKYDPYVEFDVRPGELLRPGAGVKWLFQRYQRQLPGPVDLAGRNPTFGRLSNQPPTPMLADLTPFMHLTIPTDPFASSQQGSESTGPGQPQRGK
ncbi:RHS repeat-associated core domain-containing protein [Sphaerisporangium aureirubrum]|uniref:RHS repeat-associated core domain-containing protein n=1 Tax=Sphaerisporangium aureirubrum TaxID=1544736 RepID=A0ABW1NJC0_9ACTN